MSDTDDRLELLGTAEAPDDLIELIADTMHDCSGVTVGADLVAEVAFQWCKRRLQAGSREPLQRDTAEAS